MLLTKKQRNKQTKTEIARKQYPVPLPGGRGGGNQVSDVQTRSQCDLIIMFKPICLLSHIWRSTYMIIIVIITSRMKFCHHVSTERICGRQSKVGCNRRKDFRLVGRSTMDHNITSEQNRTTNAQLRLYI